jgi:hypothetical protein
LRRRFAARGRLLTGVDKRFNRRFALREFFASPTFNNLLGLVEGAPAAASDRHTDHWPLTADIRRRLLRYVEGWSGERVSDDRLMFGANRQGSQPPLFCVLNAEYEFAGLARALGPDQPLYAVRSLYFDSGYDDEDLVQALALAYVKDLEHVCPDGPLFLLAHCQGCDIAIAMAQHLLRRGRHLPLLVLTEWMIEPVSYPGDVPLLYGRDSEYNPKFGRSHPKPAGGGCSVDSRLPSSTAAMMSFSTTFWDSPANWPGVAPRPSIDRPNSCRSRSVRANWRSPAHPLAFGPAHGWLSKSR